MLQRIKNKEIQPKVYAMSLSTPVGAKALFLHVDYTLEDALVAGKERAAKRFNLSPEDITIEAATFATVAALSEDLFLAELKGVAETTKAPVTSEISTLMAQIINTQDLILYKKSKRKLKKEEQKYVEEKLNILKK